MRLTTSSPERGAGGKSNTTVWRRFGGSTLTFDITDGLSRLRVTELAAQRRRSAPGLVGVVRSTLGRRHVLEPLLVLDAHRVEAEVVGDPQAVIDKILYEHELFGHDRMLLKTEEPANPAFYAATGLPAAST